MALVVVASAAPSAPAGCPSAWARGWQQLANRIQAPVYCPTWMPNPLDGKIGGQYIDTAYTLGAKRRHVILKVLVPLAMPSLFNSMRLPAGWS